MVQLGIKVLWQQLRQERAKRRSVLGRLEDGGVATRDGAYLPSSQHTASNQIGRL